MTDPSPKILPLGESALVVEFGDIISVDLNRRAIALAVHLTSQPFKGFIEAVPAYSSTTVYYDLVTVRHNVSEFENAFDAVSACVIAAIVNLPTTTEAERSLIEIPATFNSDCGPDLEFVSQESGLAVQTVIEVFTSKIYRVYMIGFLPGFAYMGEVDDRIRMSRKQQPRQSVPKGSVGIGGQQTGVYPIESPGGWQIIGRTEIEFFTPDATSPSLLRAGDTVRFVAI